MDASAPRAYQDDLDAWLRERRVPELVTREEATRLIQELRQDEAFWTRLRPRFERAWARAEERARGEKRTLAQLLSADAQKRLLDGVERFEPDPEAVRTFLRSPAIETMLGSVLYTGIFEFIKKVDLLGNFVNKLPVLGPIRKKIMSMVQDEIEPRLEGQIKAFLGGFSGLAVEKMIAFVLSPENKEGFRKARRRLGEHLLQRPLASLVPDAATTAGWRDSAWSGLRQAALEDEAQLLQWIYEDHGDVPLGDWWPQPSPLGRDLLARGLERFLAAKGWRLER